uniref:DNA-directed DNA polymerase n=1 Tax=Tanacetum cinerariifolium TaxID=118510 RepID=A0A6L2M6C5_TANCI|nr:DNA-directed DNA polymerase [Tanacetum cinerariifolium]
MSTRSSARNLFPPLNNPELTIRRRSRVDPTLLNDFEMATEVNGDLPVPDLRTMEELCQPSLNGRGGPIAPSKSSSSITFSFDQEIIALKDKMAEINKNLMKVLQINQQVKAVTPSCETCGGPHLYNDCPATIVQTQNVYAAGAYQGGNSYQPQGSGTLSSNTVTNTKEDLKGITTRSGTAYQGLTIPTTSSSLPKVVERETNVTKDTMPPTNNGSTKDIQPLTGRALFDVYAKELPLRVNNEAVTFNLDQTSRYSANYNDMMVNRIDVIDMACEEYSQEVLGFFDVIASGTATTYYEPIVSTSFLTLTPFGDSDFLLEEVDAFLALEDYATSSKVDHSYFDTEGDIIFLESFLNGDPSLTPLNQGMDLPPHLEYAFLEGDDKLPVIIATDLSVEEKAVLIKSLSKHRILPTKKGWFTVVENEENELIPTRLVIGWRVCIDYRKLNESAHKDHFPLPFMDQMLKRLAGNEYYSFIDGFSGYFQIPIDPKDQENTIFLRVLTKRLPTVACLLAYAMHRARSKGEKSHFMVKEGIVLGHKISKNEIEVDKAKVDVIAKLPHPTTVKGIRSFLGHAEFYRRFIQDFSKIAWPMTRLLEKDTPFFFSKECVEAFQTLKKKLTEAPILIASTGTYPLSLCAMQATLP